MNKSKYESKKYNEINQNQIVKEAIQITNELGNIAFIGAIAVYFHTKGNRSRETHDIDFAMTSNMSNDYLREKGYTIFKEHGKEVTRTPRHFKIDIYRDDVGDIPVQDIISTAKSVSVGKGKSKNIVKVANLEVLIVTKYRANRPQDGADLYDIAKTKYLEIDWPSVQSLKESEHEFQEIKTTMNRFYKM